MRTCGSLTTHPDPGVRTPPSPPLGTAPPMSRSRYRDRRTRRGSEGPGRPVVVGRKCPCTRGTRSGSTRWSSSRTRRKSGTPGSTGRGSPGRPWRLHVGRPGSVGGSGGVQYGRRLLHSPTVVRPAGVRRREESPRPPRLPKRCPGPQ